MSIIAKAIKGFWAILRQMSPFSVALKCIKIERHHTICITSLHRFCSHLQVLGKD